MTAHLSVNAVLDRIGELDGQPVEIEGVLGPPAFDGDYELLHYPKAERRDANASFLLMFGHGSIQPNRLTLARWVGKRVRVHGVAYSGDDQAGRESERFDAWFEFRPHVEVYSIQRVTSEQRKENGG